MDFYQKQLKDKGLVQDMARKGSCLGNAVVESFFSGILKSECFHTRKYASAAELKTALRESIRYCNHNGIKGLIGMKRIEFCAIQDSGFGSRLVKLFGFLEVVQTGYVFIYYWMGLS